MIRFTDKSIIIEIATGSNPVENLYYYQSAIIETLQKASQEQDHTNSFFLLELLKNTLLSSEQSECLEEFLQTDDNAEALKQVLLANKLDG